MAERADLVFHNKVIDGTAMKQLISRLIDHFGMAYTSHILDQVKTLGFQQATATSISLGIDDLLTIPSKGWLVQDAEQQSLILDKNHHYGNVHVVEKLRQSIEVWYTLSEYLKQEMNTNFRMIDPSNPVYLMSISGARGNASQVHQLVGMRGFMSDPQGQMSDLAIQSNLREGLSLTEYIISCYGARKGVIDTAIRTADAGYLTRRLVEVVQHIIVRRTDCGTIRSIAVSPPQNGMPEPILVQTLIGRVLAEDIYIGLRCIATRKKDIGIGLANRFITFRAHPIYIRTPFTCKSTSWICQLCYGRSPTHGDLVELGEAVGIIAGQSIGEPGTQLTLRTFHTGGVFTGGTAEHVRAPYNGKIRFDEDLVHPTRTRHGHPAFLCLLDFDVTIESQDIMHNVSIPAKSLILVQNDQYVESEQVIAEIRAGTPLFHSQERVQKHIYSESKGEMHWSTDVYHASEYPYSNVHLVPKTSHLWVLAGGLGRSSIVSFSLHKDQDQMNAHSLPIEERYILLTNDTNDQVKHKWLDAFGKDKKKYREILNYSKSKPYRIISNDHWNPVDSPIRYDNFDDSLAKKRRNRLLIPLQYDQDDQEREKKLIPCYGISMKIPINGILRRNSIFAYSDDSRYRRGSSGITKDGRNFATFFPQDLLQEKEDAQLRIFHYLFGNGKSITSIQFVRTCLVFNWDQEKGSCIEEKEAHASFVEIRANHLLRDFIKIELVKSMISYIAKRYDTVGSVLVSDSDNSDNGFYCTNRNPFEPKGKMKIQSSRQHQGTLGTLLNRNKECQSLRILSSSNCSRIGPFNTSRYHHNATKESDSPTPIRNLFLGAIAPKIANFCSSYYLITYNQVFLKKYLLLENFQQTFHFKALKALTFKYCFLDENRGIYNPDPCGNIVWNSVHLNWCFLHHDYCEEARTIMSLGQFLSEDVCLFKYGSPIKKSGQILVVHVDSLVIRSAKPYLVIPGATVHGHYGETFDEGETLITFLYEKSRSSDITRGLPKVEQILEARSAMNLERRVENLDKRIQGILGTPWGFFIGTELTMAQSRISLVNKIQKVYRSQGVQIHNRHIEIIVRQVTSRVLVSEDGMSNVFSPGELIGVLRAERAGRVLDEGICYRAILLGITKSSLNTQSFISEASFQETARVLAKAALRGRIDWLKGLKENVVVGGLIPAGTGLRKFVHCSKQNKNIHLKLKIKRKNLFESEMRDILLYHRELFGSCAPDNSHKTVDQ